MDHPEISAFLEVIENWSVEVDEGFFYHRDRFSFSCFELHHADEGVAPGQPIVAWFVEASDAAHDSGLADFDQDCGVHSEGVAVVAVEVCWERAAAFVSGG